jgi:hypothetical protein
MSFTSTLKIFAGKSRYSGTGPHSNGRLLALPANIRQRGKSMVVAKFLFYYDMATITAVKSFILQASGVKCTAEAPLTSVGAKQCRFLLYFLQASSTGAITTLR